MFARETSANELLSNDDILNRLAKRKDKGALGTIIGKLFEWIREAIDRFGMSELDLEAKRVLRNMERKLGKALDAGRGGVSLETVEEYAKASEKATVAKNATTEKEKTETIDNRPALRYNKLQARASLVAKYINVPQYVRNNLYSNLKQLYNGISDGIADGIALSYGNDVYIVDSGIDQGNLDFGVRKKINISDSAKRAKYIKKINQEAANDGRSDGRILEKLGVTVDNDSRSNVGRLLREDVSNSRGESKNNQDRISQTIGNRGVQVLNKKTSTSRSSLNVDSEGNSLTAEQMEYFKDSKVRDKDGNLIVVYHGTRKADFTEFKRNINFFTDNSEMADSYAPSGEKYVGYLDIKNPFVIDAKGERWSRIPLDVPIKNLLEKYGSSTFKEDGKWRTSPDDIASAIESGVDEGELNYDGIIIKNVDDTGRYWKTRDNIVANDYITFSSNQFKNKTNKSPTKKSDIRYSLDVDLDNKTTERVKTIVSDKKRSVKEVWDETLESIKAGSATSWIKAQIELTDEQAGILLAGRNVGEVLHGEVQRARSAKGAKAA